MFFKKIFPASLLLAALLFPALPLQAAPGKKPFPHAAVSVKKWAPKNLQRHWQKHRHEFPELKNAEEYGRAALLFFSAPPAGTLKKVRHNGDRLYYHPPSNNFGVTTKKGVPKTFFRPNRGMNYWKRQK